MSSIALLPLLRVNAGVQTDEDFALSIAFFLRDGVTPIDLSGIAFIASIGSLFVADTAQGFLAVSGSSLNVLSLNIHRRPQGCVANRHFRPALACQDGTAARDVFANSTLTVGAPALANVTVLMAAGGSPTAAASAVSPALAAVANLQSLRAYRRCPRARL